MAAPTPRAPEYWLLKFPAATDRPPPFASGMPAVANGASHGPALRVMKCFDQKAAGDNSQLVDGPGAHRYSAVARGLRGRRGEELQEESGRRRQRGDHAVLLQRRRVLPLRGRVPHGGHRHPDRPGHHADRQLRGVTSVCEKLLSAGAPGLHFYTLNQAALTTTIWERLNLSSRG